MALTVTERDSGVRFAVRVQPRASSSEICGLHGDALKVRLSSPPVDGAANEALVELLAGALGVTKRAVRIVAGASGRGKVVEVDGVRAGDVQRLAEQ
jgi:uncharacterized protein (TIGR00251 family)